MVLPNLCYDSEVWGTSYFKITDDVQIKITNGIMA